MPRDNLSREFFREQGRKGGKLSAKARLKNLTPEERSEIARRAAATRWGMKKPLKG
jgi:general stress protein YciG